MEYVVEVKIGGLGFIRHCDNEYDLFKSVESIVKDDMTITDKENWLSFFISDVISGFTNGKTISYVGYNFRIDVKESEVK